MIYVLIVGMVLLAVVVISLGWWIIRLDRADPAQTLEEPLLRLEDATVSLENAAEALQRELERIRVGDGERLQATQ